MHKHLWWLSSLGVLFIVLAFWRPSPQHYSGVCRFTALDVGQGDSLLIQTADDQDMLVDGGPHMDVVQKIGRHLPPGDRDLELVISTHPDADHLTGLVSVAKYIPVHKIFVSDNPGATKTYSAWQAAIDAQHIPVEQVTQGQQFTLGSSTTVQVLWPPVGYREVHPKTPTNDLSVSLKVTCAGSTVVMTGDGSTAVVEDGILASGMDISTSLYKVAHHGSRTSSSHEFLAAMHPSLAVISVGKNNRYGHPTPATLERLTTQGIQVFRTDERGDVQFESDGSGGWRITP